MQAVGFATYTHSLMCGAELQIRHEDQSETLPSTYFIIEKLTLTNTTDGVVERDSGALPYCYPTYFPAGIFSLLVQVTLSGGIRNLHSLTHV